MAGGPAGGGETILAFLCDDVPELRELVRAGLEEDDDIEVIGEAGEPITALARGADGYLSKGASLPELRDRVKAVVRGAPQGRRPRRVSGCKAG